MKLKYVILICISLSLLTSCSHFKSIHSQPEPTEPVINEFKPPKNDTSQATNKYELDLNKEMIFSDEIVHINELNKMSTDAGNKSSQQLLLDSLFANKNRSSKDIKVSYLKIVRDKKRALRKKLTEKRSLFFKDQRDRRKEYTEQANLKKKNFDHKNASPKENKQFYQNLDSERKLFYSNEKDAKKLFDSNIKSLESEIKSRFDDLDKEFQDRLKIFKAESSSR